MPRFTDEWVVDKCMFDYVNGGDCACCGFPHLFAPGGVEGLINAMSDLETDSAAREIDAARSSPWPPDMRDQIWSDRLLLRFKMKKEMRGYRAFLEKVVATATSDDVYDTAAMGVRHPAVPLLHRFCTSGLTPTQLRRMFQLPRSELAESLKDRYKICSAYSVVFCSVLDQVANFKITRYGVDARRHGGDDDGSEEEFERMLKFERNAGFCLDVVVPTTTNDRGNRVDGVECEWKVDDDVLWKFLRRMASLAGPTLLARAARNGEGGGSDRDGNEGGEIEKEDAKNTTSFRSDRRVIRLMIARYWADRLIEKYDEAQKKMDKKDGQ